MRLGERQDPGRFIVQNCFLFMEIPIHCAKHIYARFRAVQQRLTGVALGEV